MAPKTGKKKNSKPKAPPANDVLNGDAISEDAPVMVYYKWCKGCGICVAFCPKSVLDFDDTGQRPLVARPQDCIHCGLCELRCPDFAITRTRKNSRNGNNHEENGQAAKAKK